MATHEAARRRPHFNSAGAGAGAMAVLVGAAARGRITAGDAFVLSQTIEADLQAIDCHCFRPAPAAIGGGEGRQAARR
jgi:hypothetical protein